MSDMIKELYSIGLIPVIKIENADDAVPLAKALIDGGLPAAEITFRTPCAAEAIKR
ncbi:MAG: keto-hydroxyglutarate-aldolase/keto-deoxy-phosphogluconate aldolase, partial [Clostridia bacterium]|nr:keto-hydroxyglutarate-aldolase/keto-deoxy-phosphogluconate aldolase [Clostridia bacterium]